MSDEKLKEMWAAAVLIGGDNPPEHILRGFANRILLSFGGDLDRRDKAMAVPFKTK